MSNSQKKSNNKNPDYTNKVREIVDEIVSAKTLITVEEMHSPRKANDFVRARFMAWYILKIHFGFTYSLIGRLYNKDHTTVILGVGKAPEYCDTEILDGLGKMALSTYPQS